MKKRICILIIFIVSSISLQAQLTGKWPKETAILQLPDHSQDNWKEIARYVSMDEGVIEMIPLHQTIQNWSELIAIQYMNSSHWDSSIHTLDKVLELVRKETLSSYPKNVVSWQIVEKDKKGITYEWILHKPYKNISAQHEIARAFLTPSGFHRIGFTRKDGHMKPEERAKWIQLLRENSLVIPFQEGKRIEGFSMVERLQDSVSLGDFHDWKMNHRFASATGYSLACHLPPTQMNSHTVIHSNSLKEKGKHAKKINNSSKRAKTADSYVTECLEIITMPNIHAMSLIQLFEAEKKYVWDKISKKVKFHVIQKSPTEIIYFYCHPKDHLQLNAVVRAFLTDYGYYSISYKKGLDGRMQRKEVTSWLEKLKTVHVEPSPRKQT